MNSHSKAVNEFMKMSRERNPQQYTEVCKRYPTLGSRQWKQINESETGFTSSQLEDLYSSDEDLPQEE